VVFLYPCAHILYQIQRDIYGFSFAFVHKGQIVAYVLLTARHAAAGWAAAVPGDLHQAGGKHGAAGLQLLDAGIDHLLNERGVLGYLHRSVSLSAAHSDETVYG
jgi:hypothetical protein